MTLFLNYWDAARSPTPPLYSMYSWLERILTKSLNTLTELAITYSSVVV
jgi:hypothetical protein